MEADCWKSEFRGRGAFALTFRPGDLIILARQISGVYRRANSRCEHVFGLSPFRARPPFPLFLAAHMPRKSGNANCGKLNTSPTAHGFRLDQDELFFDTLQRGAYRECTGFKIDIGPS